MEKNKKADKHSSIRALLSTFILSVDEASANAFAFLEDMDIQMKQRGIKPLLKLLVPCRFGLLTYNGRQNYAFAFEYENNTQGEYVKHELYIFIEKRLKPLPAVPCKCFFAQLAPGQCFECRGLTFSWCRDGRIIKNKK